LFGIEILDKIALNCTPLRGMRWQLRLCQRYIHGMQFSATPEAAKMGLGVKGFLGLGFRGSRAVFLVRYHHKQTSNSRS